MPFINWIFGSSKNFAVRDFSSHIIRIRCSWVKTSGQVGEGRHVDREWSRIRKVFAITATVTALAGRSWRLSFLVVLFLSWPPFALLVLHVWFHCIMLWDLWHDYLSINAAVSDDTSIEVIAYMLIIYTNIIDSRVGSAMYFGVSVRVI